MTSLIAKSEGHADKNGTLISQNPLKYQIDFGQPEASNVVWNIIYDNGEGCSGETQYTVNGTGSCTNVTISCVPTEKQLQDGSAATVVTVTSNGNACTRKFYCEQETGHPQHNSGYEFTAHTAGTYVFRSVDDTAKTCTFLVTESACNITNIKCEPSEYTLTSSTDVASGVITVTASENRCERWVARVNEGSGEIIKTGDNSTPLTVSKAQTVTIRPQDSSSQLSCTFLVKPYLPPPVFTTKIEVGVDSMYGTHMDFTTTDSTYCTRLASGYLQIAGNFVGTMDITVTINQASLTQYARDTHKVKYWINDYDGLLTGTPDGFTKEGASQYSAIVDGLYYSTSFTQRNDQGDEGNIRISFSIEWPIP